MKKIFLFINFTSLLILLALFVSVPRPSLAADPPPVCPIDTTVVDKDLVKSYRQRAGIGGFLQPSGSSQSECTSKESNVGGYGGFVGFNYCSAAPYYSGKTNAPLDKDAGCYPILQDRNGSYLAPFYNKSFKTDVPSTCPKLANGTQCQKTSSGGCTGPAGCAALAPTCNTDFGNFSPQPDGSCVIESKNITAVVGSLAGAPIHLCLPGEPCDTALGMIPLNPAAFVEKIIKLILGISGGIIIIMAIVAGYNVMTSAGDPQKLAGSKEMIVSIITGAFMIVFSMILLNAIGIDILGLPPLIQFRGYGGDGG